MKINFVRVNDENQMPVSCETNFQPNGRQSEPNKRTQYCVSVEGMGAPKLAHYSLESAEEEAKRLCVQEWRSASVLMVVKKFKPQAVEVG